MESLTLDANPRTSGDATRREDTALQLLRDVWRTGSRGRDHQMLVAASVVLESGRLRARGERGEVSTAAMAAARAAGADARARGGGGTTLPGKVLLSEDPAALGVLGRRLRLGSVLVGGTNGKTTTAAMLASALNESGLSVVHNRAGANTHWGVATALLDQSGDIGVFEVDEAWLPLIAVELEPRAIALGNLFRDRTDGYGELDAIARAWSSLARRGRATFVLDADDPSVASIGGAALFYGIDDPRVGVAGDEHAADATTCRRCDAPLLFERRFLSHLGQWSCAACGASRPAPSVSAGRVELNGLAGSSLQVDTPAGSLALRLEVPGVFSVYNALAAAAAGVALDVPGDAIVRGLERTRAPFGRSERIRVGDRSELVILLMKNPAGANALIRLLETEPPGLHLWVALNDATADGRDVSWVWDADFERLAPRVARVTCAGTRAHELALRLKYAGWPRDSIAVEPRIAGALDDALAHAGGRLVALPTYTALVELRDLLARRGLARSWWE